jgi:hypothetical protein
MAAKFVNPIVLVQSVAPGRTATVRPEVGRRINKILLKVQATAQVANQIIDTITVKVGGVPQRTMTPDELDCEYRLMGENSSAQYAIQQNTAGSEIHIPIWFREPWRKGLQTARILGWNTGDVAEDEFVVEVKLLSSAAADVTLDAEVEYDNPVDQQGKALPMGDIVKWYEEDVEITGVEKKWPLQKFDSLISCTFHDADIDKLELFVGDVTVRTLYEASNQSHLTGDGMTPQASKFHLVLDHDDDLLSAIPLENQKNAYVKLTLADGTPRNIRALLQRVGRRDGEK